MSVHVCSCKRYRLPYKSVLGCLTLVQKCMHCHYHFTFWLYARYTIKDKENSREVMLILSTCIKQKARVLIPHEQCCISLFASLYFQVSTCTHQPTTLFILGDFFFHVYFERCLHYIACRRKDFCLSNSKYVVHVWLWKTIYLGNNLNLCRNTRSSSMLFPPGIESNIFHWHNSKRIGHKFRNLVIVLAPSQTLYKSWIAIQKYLHSLCEISYSLL